MNPRTLLTATITCLVVMSFAMGGTTARLPVEDAETSEYTDLDALAHLFNEVPVSTAPTTNSLGSTECGTSGHCNWLTCPQPDCEPGQSSYCSCKASGQQCEDTHNPFNPFDNDKHPVYDCTCGCVSNPPPPPDCVLEEPIRICTDGVDLPCGLGARWAVPEIGKMLEICKDLNS